jgi:uncharacterized protein (TIGR02284 family)
MNSANVKDSLEKIAERLQDSIEGYEEIAAATSKSRIKTMVDIFAKERKEMKQKVLAHLKDFGYNPEIKSSFAGDLHRAWIDIKVNGWGDDFVSIVDEIERGSNVLLDEFQIVLDTVNLNSSLYLFLTRLQEKVNLELNELLRLRKEIELVTV